MTRGGEEGGGGAQLWGLSGAPERADARRYEMMAVRAIPQSGAEARRDEIARE